MTKLIEHTEQKVKSDKKEKYRLTTFKKALNSIKDYDHKITSGSQALQLEGIGKGTAERIDEFFKTGTLAELTRNIDPSIQLLVDLQNIHGIGPVTAKNLISQGIISVEDLIMKVNKKDINVTHSINVGLKYYVDFKIKIPYDEIHEIYSSIQDIIIKIYPDVTMDCCGSHRRKKALSGDMDILITHPNKTFSRELPKIIKILTDKGILIDNLTELGLSKYMGVCIHPKINIGRRIDIRFIDYDSYFYAILYFTGNVWVNKEMRTIAIKKNMTLNEYSLVNNYTGEKYIVNSEKEIFDILEIKYLKPEEREL